MRKYDGFVKLSQVLLAVGGKYQSISGSFENEVKNSPFHTIFVEEFVGTASLSPLQSENEIVCLLSNAFEMSAHDFFPFWGFSRRSFTGNFLISVFSFVFVLTSVVFRFFSFFLIKFSRRLTISSFFNLRTSKNSFKYFRICYYVQKYCITWSPYTREGIFDPPVWEGVKSCNRNRVLYRGYQIRLYHGFDHIRV